MGHDLWVTSALWDEEAKACIVLAESLKKVMSNKKISVIVSTRVSNNLRNLLWTEFDHVFAIEESWNRNAMNEETFLKMFVLTLQRMDKCVYLHPNSLVIANSDHIFDILDSKIHLVLPKPELGPVFIFGIKPSFFDYNKAINVKSDLCVEKILKIAYKQNMLDIKYLDPGYLLQLPLQSDFSTAAIHIVHFNEKSENPGIYEKWIEEVWEKMYEKHYPRFKVNCDELCELNWPLKQEVKEGVAIVGIGCRYPAADNLEEFWNILIHGQVVIDKLPMTRWFGNTKEGQLPGGFIKQRVDEFDGEFFGISRKELEYLDPQQRILLEVVWEAIENAGMTLESVKCREGGVFSGSWNNDFSTILLKSGRDEFYRKYMGNSVGAAGARISSLLQLTGPNIATESGCSSAMVAIHLAYKSLLSKEVEFALACGVNLLLSPYDKNFFPTAVSPKGICKTFDAKADGFVRADGCGVLVLKRLSDAVKNNDKIWAVIRGTGISQEGISPSLGTPTEHSEALAMEKALADANMKPEDISYLEAHGTGTVVGDPIEMAAITKIYSRGRNEPLYVGSVKTNIGHTESCSGITGITKVVLALNHEVIPAHKGFETLNPAIDLESIPAVIPLVPVPWPKDSKKKRVAGVSSFGVTGTDAHIIVEEAPNICTFQFKPLLERPMHLLTISAKAQKALKVLIGKYAEMLTTSVAPFSDIAYSANIGRTKFSHRAVLIARGNDEAARILESDTVMQNFISEKAGNICFLFPGQGSQFPGMAKELHDTSPLFRMHFDYCVKFLQNNFKIDIFNVIWGDNTDKKYVNRSLYSQLSIFCVEYGLMKLWESWGVKPDFVLGHSLGEFSAAVCAGILSVEDALNLVAHRSLLIDKLSQGKMLVVGAEKEKVDKLLQKFSENEKGYLLDFAALNSHEQTVIAGDSDVITEFIQVCKADNIKCTLLKATHAFHSRHMDPILHEFKLVTEKIKPQTNFKCGYISGMTGYNTNCSEINPNYWVQHMREKVNFLKASETAVNQLKTFIFIEIGPQPILAGLTMINCNSKVTCLPSMRKTETNWTTLLASLAQLYLKGVEIDWTGFDRFFPRKKVVLPNYPFQRIRYWPGETSRKIISPHPLLGSNFSNATSAKIFQNDINLEKLEYLRDHMFGTKIVFPGAAFLEMGIVAGYLATTGDSIFTTHSQAPITMENVSFTAPLSLHEGKTVLAQTVVQLPSLENKSEKMGLNVKISSLKVTFNCEKWQEHVTARFIPFDTNCSISLKTVPDKDTFYSIISVPGDPTLMNGFYSTTGKDFGDTFRSLEGGWSINDGFIFIVKIPPGYNDHIARPILLDAMLQVFLISSSNLSRNQNGVIQMVFGINKFVWFGKSFEASRKYYVGACSKSAWLLDDNGSCLATMSGVETMPTLIKTLEGKINEQNCNLPDFWDETWIGTQGLMADRINLSTDKSIFHQISEGTPVEIHFVNESTEVKMLNKLVDFNMLKCLYELGWDGKCKEFSQSKLFNQFRILSKHHKYVAAFLNILEKEGIFKNIDDSWSVTSSPPSYSEIMIFLKVNGSQVLNHFRSYSLVQHVGSNLVEILAGVRTTQDVLFSTINRMGVSTVEEFYEDLFSLFDMEKSVVNSISRVLTKCKDSGKITLRILEIGGGTGRFTRILTNLLEQLELDFEYTFTDISSAFFPPAEKKFEKFGNKFIFRKLNITKDPMMQGFIPEYYDYIAAYDVLHTTENIADTLSHVRLLLRSGGCLEILEQLEMDKLIFFTFGSLEGYWNFNDFHLRPHHAFLDKEQWIHQLDLGGFNVFHVEKCGKSHEALITASKRLDTIKLSESKEGKQVWLVYEFNCKLSTFIQQKFLNLKRKVINIQNGDKFQELNHGSKFQIRKDSKTDFVTILTSLCSKGLVLEGILYCWSLDKSIVSQEVILQPFFILCQVILEQNIFPRVIALTTCSVPVESSTDVSYFHSSTLAGFTKSLKRENQEMDCRCIEIYGGDLSKERMQEVFYELWNKSDRTQVVLHQGDRYFAKLQSDKPTMNTLSVPLGAGGRFQVRLPDSKSFGDLQLTFLPPTQVKENEVEVHVKAWALNFHDIFSILKPTYESSQRDSIGMDFSGVVRKIGKGVTKWNQGDCVFGLNFGGGAFPSHVILKQEDVYKLPAKLTFNEVSTLPAVFCTAYHCLIGVAKLKPSDTILIHSASGGVGLCAIQLANTIGAKIIATAGSTRKRNYLRNLGIQHVFNSRTTDFLDDILKVTNQSGVNVVLNSLTSTGFKEATLKACTSGACFIEMAKMNIWTVEEVKNLRPDVHYKIIFIANLPSKYIRHLMCCLLEYLEKGMVRPLPYERFRGTQIHEALEYLYKGKHIGKIVCVMPDSSMKSEEMKEIIPMFNRRSTYLITGGLGGVGFAVAKWMLASGAKYIILAGRNPPNFEIQKEISNLNSSGGNLLPIQVDVGDFNKLKEVLGNVCNKGLPPLRGVMHAANVIADGLVSSQDWNRFSSSFNAKLDGTLNLHLLTRQLPLEHFVLFSSIASLFGTPGQSNHAAGSAFFDAFAHFRHSMGLPALSINWGPWSEVGSAKYIEFPGVMHISPFLGVSALGHVLETHKTQTCVMTVSSPYLLKKFLPVAGVYLDETVWKCEDNEGLPDDLTCDTFWLEYKAGNEKEKISLLKRQITKILQKVLKNQKNEVIDEAAQFQDLGVDSLMFVELRNLVQDMLKNNISLGMGSLRDNNSVNLLALYLEKVISGDLFSPNGVPSMEQVAKLIHQDSFLEPKITAKSREIRNIHDAKIVFLTGVTGTLGPYILHELCQSYNLTKVYCLVRSLKDLPGDIRQTKILEQLHLPLINKDIVEIVKGDLGLGHMGITKSKYESLANTVDAIIHCAAKVDLMEYYSENQTPTSTRAVNVKGMKNILDFACSGNGHVKHVFSASSVMAITGKENNCVPESWPEIESFNGVSIFAYPVSKHICDVLAKQAVERGIPVKVFRFPFIAGNSKTGRFVEHQVHLVMRSLYLMKTGMIPEHTFLHQILPADFCAKAALQVFFSERAPPDLYNILHPKRLSESDFQGIAKKFGFSVELVNFQTFAEKLNNDDNFTSPFLVFREFYTFQDMYIKQVLLVLSGSISGLREPFQSKKLSKLFPDLFKMLEPPSKYLERDLRFAKEQGWFSKLG